VGDTVVAQQANPRVDAEDVEAVVRYPAGQDTVRNRTELTTCTAAEPVFHRISQRSDPDLIEQRVANPVGLHDSVIERVGNSDCASDEFQIGPGTIELPCQRGQPTVYDAGGTVSQQLLAI
jgi:hypothetical protein